MGSWQRGTKLLLLLKQRMLRRNIRRRKFDNLHTGVEIDNDKPVDVKDTVTPVEVEKASKEETVDIEKTWVEIRVDMKEDVEGYKTIDVEYNDKTEDVALERTICLARGMLPPIDEH